MVPLLGALSYAAPADDLRLVDAVKNRDRAAVRSLMEQQVNVNAAQPDGTTALAWAANRDDLETADLLIRAGADVNKANDYGVTPLSLACTNRSALMVERLLKAAADPNAALWTGETPLMVCARTGNVETVNVLLSRGANPNAKENEQGQTALMRAVAERHPEIVRALIDGGADVRARSKGGFTALLFAGQQGEVASARILLAAGADVNEATPKNGTALVVAAASGREEFAIFLLENGADPNAADAYGVTALHYAVPRGIAGIDSVSIVFRPYHELPSSMPELAKSLLAHRANPNVQIAKDFPPYSRSPYALQTSLVGVTPFLLAAAAADVDLMRTLLRAGADPHIKSKDGSTALMMASGVGRIDERENNKEDAGALEAAKLALMLGDDINAANARGRTALHGAAGTGANAIIQFLFEKGANLNAKDRGGYTPLGLAKGLAPRGGDSASQVYDGSVALLLKLGAQP
ncbi:MAG TPA: ankyrin repeat domain-containing protein [Terriglobia bacterium]|nr:ankyrin repeat domain-containing protein [Terriglobia bacterium]